VDNIDSEQEIIPETVEKLWNMLLYFCILADRASRTQDRLAQGEALL
jgi:hypothetical protein